jgi:hypothetical protein
LKNQELQTLALQKKIPNAQVEKEIGLRLKIKELMDYQ